MSHARLGWLGVCLVLSACNCGLDGPGDAGDAGASDAGGGLSDAGEVDGGEADAGATDAGDGDGGEVDAGLSDAGAADAGFTPGRFFSFRLAYRPEPEPSWTPPAFADLCVRPTSSTTWTRVYGLPGVGLGEVGRQHRVVGGAWTFKVIDVTQPCDQPGLYQSTQTLGNDSTHKRVTVSFVRGRISGVVAREQFARFDDSQLGSQDWLVAYPDSATSNLFFATDGGAQVRIESSLVRLDGGAAGAMTLGTTSVGYRTGTNTVTSVFFNGLTPAVAPLFCDDFAPAAGVLSVCSTNLRPP